MMRTRYLGQLLYTTTHDTRCFENRITELKVLSSISRGSEDMEQTTGQPSRLATAALLTFPHRFTATHSDVIFLVFVC